ncbi:MAG: aspartate carbamoyltransferase regulatory subunit [Bacteroidales bacterium]|nr:aspartate carbamoyltransferase regulatory subunit [Bacteroidales bacterium]
MANKPVKELVVSAIENGTVIDHIPAQSVFQVMKILGLDQVDSQVLFGTNLDSRKYGKKGIIKVQDKFFERDDVNKIALVAPTATIIEIKDYKVVLKQHVDIPENAFKIVKCVNPNCITNHEDIPTKFRVVKEESGDLKLKCGYCEKFTNKENMVFI